MSLVLSSIIVSISINFSFQYQDQYQDQDQEKMIQESIYEDQEEARVSEGGAVLCSFIDWFLLLLVARCLLGLVSLSCLVYAVLVSLHLFGLSSLELGSSLCR